MTSSCDSNEHITHEYKRWRNTSACCLPFHGEYWKQHRDICGSKWKHSSYVSWCAYQDRNCYSSLTTHNHGAGIHCAALQWGLSFPSAFPGLSHLPQSILRILYSNSGRTNTCITTATINRVSPCHCKFELQFPRRPRYQSARENVLRNRLVLNLSVVQTRTWAPHLNRSCCLPPTKHNLLSITIPRIVVPERMKFQLCNSPLPKGCHWLAKIHPWATCLATQSL